MSVGLALYRLSIPGVRLTGPTSVPPDFGPGQGAQGVGTIIRFSGSDFAIPTNLLVGVKAVPGPLG